MLIVRYFNNHIVKDTDVTVKNAHETYRHLRRKFGYAELILLENGIEYCLI